MFQTLTEQILIKAPKCRTFSNIRFELQRSKFQCLKVAFCEAANLEFQTPTE